MAADEKKRVFNPKVETRLKRSDLNRLDEAAKLAGKSRSDFVRQVLTWYLDNQEIMKDNEREKETAVAIRHGTAEMIKVLDKVADRICGMMARQGAEIGTLYELAWRASGSPEAKGQFESAANKARQRQRERLDEDEKRIREKTKKVVTS